MKDTPKNFGLSQSLIDVVKNVVGEELKGGQKNLDANKNGKIDGEDFALLRKKKMKEEVEQIEELHSLKGKSLVDLKDMRDTARTKMNSHSKLSREYFRADKYSDGKKHQAIANQHEDDFNRIQKAIKSHPDYMKKEEVEEVEEAVYTPKGYDESPVKGVDPRIVQPIKNLKKKPLPGEMGLKFGKIKEAISPKDKADEGEYDYEGDMAKSQLRSIIANSQRVHDMLEDTTNLPEWVQSKITLAEDYISTTANYLTSEVNEETLDEARGRPKGSKNKPKEGSVTKASKVIAAVKRGRGRPRKNPVENEAGEDEEESKDREHIIMGLRKAVSLRGQHNVQFADGSSHKISQADAQKALAIHTGLNSNEKANFEKKLAASHSKFKDTLKDKNPGAEEEEEDLLKPRPLNYRK